MTAFDDIFNTINDYKSELDRLMSDYDSNKCILNASDLYNKRYLCMNQIKKIVEYIECSFLEYPTEMTDNEKDILDILRNVADQYNRLMYDEIASAMD